MLALGGSEDFRQAAVVPSGGRLSPLEADDFLVLEGEEDCSCGGGRGVRLGGGGDSCGSSGSDC